jgi:hypothetical protein
LNLEDLKGLVAHMQWADAEVNTRLRELGLEPAVTDYIARLRFGRPGPSRPEG